MSGNRLIYYILAAFIAGNLLLIFIQYNSAKNINNLIGGNVQLLNEYEVSGYLKDLERDIISIESKIRGTVSTSDSSHIQGLDTKIAAVDGELTKLNKISDDDSSVKYVDELERLVHEKLFYSKQALDSFHISGKYAAEKVIDLQKGKAITDSIIIITSKIHDLRAKLLEKVIASNDTSGKKALRFGTILISIVLISAAVLFWIIINTIRNQNQLIEQLHISQQKEREAARVKENFLANMSHEIRTPMNAMLGFTNLLQRKALDAEAKEYVSKIQKSGETLLNIIDDILDLSKIEAGMMRIEPAPFSIRGLLHSVETLFKLKLEARQLQLTTQVDTSLPDTLVGDATRLTQILVNLVGNAVKFTQQGKITIDITNQGMAENKVQTAIKVSDTGIGIAEEKLNTIFERFQQAEASVTREYGGTGLGLSIVKELVQLQHGSLSVESQPGKGTSFTVIIPYQISTEQIGMPPQAVEPAFDQESVFSNVSILVVEDNEINQSLIRHLFKNWNISFDMASNGSEAILMLQQKEYNLILMDIQMPVMDGYTATQEIRKTHGISTPIIAMTAHAFAGEREKCLSFGMNDYISKPIREEQLQKLIAQFTGSHPATQPGTAATVHVTSPHQFIDLHYMKEISGGNRDYEKAVTEQFIEMIPEELHAIEQAWQQGNLPLVRSKAHNMKTTVSVMGLTEILNPLLDALEYNELTAPTFTNLFRELQSICTGAVAEAKALLAILQ